MDNTSYMTAEELKCCIDDDPRWLAKHATRTHPVVITNFCDLSLSPIEALSPFAEFRGNNQKGICAEFLGCDIEIAEGKFHGKVDFTQSNITKIGELVVTKPCLVGIAARFTRCEHLKIATGSYPGLVLFNDSGVVTVENLKVNISDEFKHAMNFSNCKNLRTVISAECNGTVSFRESSLREIKNLKVQILKPASPEDLYIDLRDCNELVRCPDQILTHEMTAIEGHNHKRIMLFKEHEQKARQALKTSQPSLEL